MKFRLMEKDAQGNKTGSHSQGKVVRGRFSERYRAGDIITTDEPLDKLFRGKFERLDGGPSPEPAEPRRRKGRK
jgi:hypothetical protein